MRVLELLNSIEEIYPIVRKGIKENQEWTNGDYFFIFLLDSEIFMKKYKCSQKKLVEVVFFSFSLTLSLLFLLQNDLNTSWATETSSSKTLSTASLISPSFQGGPTICHRGNFLKHTCCYPSTGPLIGWMVSKVNHAC